jgi:hypothetical protein
MENSKSVKLNIIRQLIRVNKKLLVQLYGLEGCEILEDLDNKVFKDKEDLDIQEAIDFVKQIDSINPDTVYKTL